jgi:glycosyltransferase involved in cell wall biosynthesis
MAFQLAAQGVPVERLTVIHNWADGDAIQPLDPADNTLRTEWGLADRFVVGYSGNLGRAHEFNTILDAAEMHRDDAGIVFLFIGGGHYLDFVEAEARRRSLSNVFIRPFQPARRLRETLAVPDLHLVSLLPALEGLIVPSKFYGIAAAGRPLIFLGSPSGEIAGLLRDSSCGAPVAVGDVHSLADHIRALRRSPAERAFRGRNARALFVQRFDRPSAVALWNDALACAIAVANASTPRKTADGDKATARMAQKATARTPEAWDATAGSRAR